MHILNGVNLPVHPSTGLRALGMGRRGPIWPVMGGSQPTGNEGQQQSGAGGQQASGGQGAGGQQSGGQQGGGGGQQQSGAGSSGTGAAGSSTSQQGAGQQQGGASQGGQQQGDGDRGFPADTPVAEMTDKQQAAYWRYQSRKHEGQAKSSAAELADLRPKAKQYDDLAAASRTEHERALDEAKAQARAEADRDAALKIAAAEMRVAAKGRIDDAKLAAVLEPIDMSKFLADDNTVDTARVAAFVDGIAPAQQAGGAKSPDMGQGRREAGTASGVESGRSLYRERHPAKASTART
jgi:hypothetical protein